MGGHRPQLLPGPDRLLQQDVARLLRELPLPAPLLARLSGLLGRGYVHLPEAR